MTWQGVDANLNSYEVSLRDKIPDRLLAKLVLNNLFSFELYSRTEYNYLTGSSSLSLSSIYWTVKLRCKDLSSWDDGLLELATEELQLSTTELDYYGITLL